MTRPSAIAAVAAVIILAAPAIAMAQNKSVPRGTNSAGTAQSSGPASNRDRDITTGSAGMGSGKAATPPTTSSETAIKNENDTIDRKLKGICRGC